MQTNVLISLRSEVASAPNLAAKGEALASLGCYLAQRGDFVEAGDICRNLKKSYATGDYPRISIKLMVLEALLGYYSIKSESSFDRINRANAVAAACGYQDLVGESAVWVAHLAFNFERYFEFGEALHAALHRFDVLQDQSRARVCLSIADAEQYLGEQGRSDQWYKFSRIFSRRVHDHVLIASTEYNRLIMGLARYRVGRAIRQPINVDQRNWYAELASVQALTERFGGKALPELIDMCNLLTCQLAEDYAGAIQSLTRILEAKATDVCGMSENLAQLERVWCSLHLDDTSVDDVRDSIELTRLEQLSLNDQLIALAFVEDICKIKGIEIDQSRFVEVSNRAIAYYERTTSDMRTGLACADAYMDLVREIALTGRKIADVDRIQ